MLGEELPDVLRDFRAMQIEAFDSIERDDGRAVSPMDFAVFKPDLRADIAVIADNAPHIVLIFLDDFNQFRHDKPLSPEARLFTLLHPRGVTRLLTPS